MRRRLPSPRERRDRRRFFNAGVSCLPRGFPVSYETMHKGLPFSVGDLMDDCDRSELLQRDLVRRRRNARIALRVAEMLIWFLLIGIAAWLLYPVAENLRNLPDPNLTGR